MPKKIEKIEKELDSTNKITTAKNAKKIDETKSSSPIKTKATSKRSTNVDSKKDTKTTKTSGVKQTKTTKSNTTKTTKTSKTSTTPRKKAVSNSSKDDLNQTTKTTKKVSKESVTKTTKNLTSKKKLKLLKKYSLKLTKKKLFADLVEYYDLPNRYHQTVVKVLAQTPTILFVYWDLSDHDRFLYETNYGKDFFNYTYPVLIVHNETKGYNFEITIDDFANNWYINVPDSRCNYKIELGRRSRNSALILPNNYISISSSNKIEAPNDHILFEELGNTIYYKNVKNNSITSKDIASLSFMKHIGKIYNIYDLYKRIYGSENLDFDLNNPSSMPTSS